MKILEIKLRNKEFVAPDPQVEEILILASLFLPGDSDKDRLETLQQRLYGMQEAPLLDIDLEDEEQRFKWTALLISRLLEPVTKAKIAHALTSLFPDLPKDWVNYQLVTLPNGWYENNFHYKLNTSELMDIVKACLAYLSPEQKKDPKKPSHNPYKAKYAASRPYR